jgi:dTMP kinase
MAKGLFITFEGIDGSGKTTVAKRVVEALKQKGYDALYTCEPTGSEMGTALKSGYEKEVNPFMELFMFLADRASHTKDIMKWVEDGKIVVCDRYADSTYAYQAVMLEDALKGVGIEPLDWLKKISEPFIVQPDLTLLFQIEPSDALKRIRRKGTKFEREKFLKKVQGVYEKLAESESRFVKIDASEKLAEVSQQGLEVVLSML